MLFNSIEFLIFFPIVVIIYLIIPKRIRYLWLLIASYYFYMNWNEQYAILIALSTLITYVCGLVIEQARKKEWKYNEIWCKSFLAFGVVSNLAILIFYKYFGFILENLNQMRSVMHRSAVTVRYNILLPVGISFYTFQALGYLIDVYRKDVKAEKNILKYALFVSFFPQLIMGPINRFDKLGIQLKEEHEFDFENRFLYKIVAE